MPGVVGNEPVPEYGAVPPTADIVTVGESPAQLIAVAVEDAIISDGSVIVVNVEVEQPLASVIT